MRRRSLVVLLALVASLNVPAGAQTCLGLTAYTAEGPIQAIGRGSLTSESTSFGAGLGYGLPASVFGGLAVASTADDNLGGSTLEIGATVGYQIPLWNAGAVQLCPIASFSVGLGPRNPVNTGVDRSRRTASVGVAIARSLVASPRFRIVPSVGLAYAYRKDEAKNNAGASLFQIAEHYPLAQVGVGLVLDSNISLRPGIDIPFNLETNEPSVGLTLSYSFGHSR
jgi:hypothetical protein